MYKVIVNKHFLWKEGRQSVVRVNWKSMDRLWRHWHCFDYRSDLACLDECMWNAHGDLILKLLTQKSVYNLRIRSSNTFRVHLQIQLLMPTQCEYTRKVKKTSHQHSSFWKMLQCWKENTFFCLFAFFNICLVIFTFMTYLKQYYGIWKYWAHPTMFGYLFQCLKFTQIGLHLFSA